MGGVDGPADAANAGPRFAAERNAAPLFPLTVVQDDIPHAEPNPNSHTKAILSSMKTAESGL